MLKNSILSSVGKTPMVTLRDKKLENINLFVKLEGNNPTGSVKDRAASYVLDKLLETGEINKDTTIIESSSGNFGISLASYCKEKGLKYCCVIDPNILPINETIIRSLATEVIKVTERDETGGFLKTRIRLIEELICAKENYYWVNQYGNPYVAEAYYNSIGVEICNEVKVDYAFIGVSSGGTITGISNRIKKEYPHSKIIAVDSIGSLVFTDKPQKRYIPGIGSSMRPKIIEKAIIDDVVLISEADTAKKCLELLKKHSILVGGSSGTVIAAIEKYFRNKKFKDKPNVVCLFADRGDRYAGTIYCDEWLNNNLL
ncbi:MAG TPA: 2,3-diaminopropionate biosynthesis protein SbnA [Ignavibacteria bacterium]